MEKKKREIFCFSEGEAKYSSLKEIIVYLRSLVATFKYAGADNENLASCIYDLCKYHVSVRELTDDEFAQLLHEFNSLNCHSIHMLRFSFLELFLVERKKISFSLATEIYDLLKDWSYDSVIKAITERIHWERGSATEVVLFGKKFDKEFVWDWINTQNKQKEILSRKTFVSIAKEAKNFPKEILLSWAGETVLT